MTSDRGGSPSIRYLRGPNFARIQKADGIRIKKGCLRLRPTSDLKNKTQIANTELDADLKSDRDPIY